MVESAPDKRRGLLGILPRVGDFGGNSLGGVALWPCMKLNEPEAFSKSTSNQKDNDADSAADSSAGAGQHQQPRPLLRVIAEDMSA